MNTCPPADMSTMPVPHVMVFVSAKVISEIVAAIRIFPAPLVVISPSVMLSPLEVIEIFPPPVASMLPPNVRTPNASMVTLYPVAPVATMFPLKVRKVLGANT